jgi:hypothetical protein
VRGEGCVTLIMNTHRTRPDSEKDPLKLKNQVKEAEERLYREFDKRFVWPIMENLRAVVEHIDHRYNLESLMIFVNQHMGEYTRLPIAVTDRVVIDQTFATRDLIRSLHQEAGYYVLVLSRQQARLIEAFNDRVVNDSCGPFPVTNPLYTTSRQDLSSNKGTDNLIEEFFNRVDKLLQEYVKRNPMPLILATETRNYDYFVKVADIQQMIIGHVNKNRDEEKAHHIVSEVWPEVRQHHIHRHQSRIGELSGAVKGGRLLTDLNEIWRALTEGRGSTLFVRQGHYIPARITENGIVPVSAGEVSSSQGIVDDIVDEMIEMNLRYRGDTVFVEGDLPEGGGKIALIVRY